jgi:hypothetical protein
MSEGWVPRRRILGVVECAVVVAVSAALTALLTYPFVVQMATVGRVDNGDGQFGIWNVSWVARMAILDPLRLLDANIFYPHRLTLAYSENNIGAGLLAIPAYWATRNPYFAYNAVFLLSFVASACGAYYLVRYLTRDRWAAAIAGIGFAFCPYVFARTAEIQLMMTAGLPFSLLAFHRLADRPTVGRGIALGAVMTGQALCCGYYGVFAMLMIGFATFAVAASRGLWRNARYWSAIGVAAATAMLLVAPVFAPYALLRYRTGFARPLAESLRYSANWEAYLASGAAGHLWMLPFVNGFNEVLFPGFVITALGVVGVLAAWRWADRLREPIVLYCSLAALALWASFGPAAKLYALMYDLVPLLSWLHAPARFGIVVALALSVLSGIALSRFRYRFALSPAIAFGIAIIALVELAHPLKFTSVPTLDPAYRVLARQPTAPLVELPFFARRGEMTLHSQYMLNSTTHWMPLVNGYSDFIPQDFRRAAPTLAGFPSKEALKVLEPLQPRYVMIHLDQFAPSARASIIDRLDEFASHLRPIFATDDTRLYEITSFH